MKYEFTGETLTWDGHTLKQIRRLSDGEIGGWIEKTGNLSHYGGCWVSGSAKVYGTAMVCGDAKVFGDAQVCGDANVHNDDEVCGDGWHIHDTRNGTPPKLPIAETSGSTVTLTVPEGTNVEIIYGGALE